MSLISMLSNTNNRFGSAEIYNVMDTFSNVADSLCVGQKMRGDERVVLFVKMAGNLMLVFYVALLNFAPVNILS